MTRIGFGLGLAAVCASAGSGCGGHSAPAAAAPPAYLTSAAVDGVSGRACRYVSPPGEMPGFGSLVRPGTRGSLALLGRDMAATDSVEFSVRYDGDGRLAWVRAVRSSLPSSEIGGLEQLLFEAVREGGPAEWGFRMQLVGGDVVSLAPSVRCSADARQTRINSGPLPVGSISYVEVGDRVLRRPFPVLISIDEEGRVTGVEVATSGTDFGTDQLLMEWILTLTFEPELHDGFPVATTVREIIRVPLRP